MWEHDWNIKINEEKWLDMFTNFPFKQASVIARKTALKILQKWYLTQLWLSPTNPEMSPMSTNQPTNQPKIPRPVWEEVLNYK